MTHTELGLPVPIQTLIFHRNSPYGITGSPCSISSYAELCNFSKGMPFMRKYTHKYNEILKNRSFTQQRMTLIAKTKHASSGEISTFFPFEKTDFLCVSIVDYYRDACG